EKLFKFIFYLIQLRRSRIPVSPLRSATNRKAPVYQHPTERLRHAAINKTAAAFPARLRTHRSLRIFSHAFSPNTFPIHRNSGAAARLLYDSQETNSTA